MVFGYCDVVKLNIRRPEVFCFSLPWHSSVVLSAVSSHVSFKKCVETEYLRRFYFSSTFERNAIQKLVREADWHVSR